MGHLWESEEEQGCRLASREQLQSVRDHGEESAISGRGKSDGGLR